MVVSDDEEISTSVRPIPGDALTKVAAVGEGEEPVARLPPVEPRCDWDEEVDGSYGYNKTSSIHLKAPHLSILEISLYILPSAYLYLPTHLSVSQSI